MVAHAITIDTRTRPESGALQYRWRCSCGEHAKSWWSSRANGSHALTAARRARHGGVRHVAAMERGR